ncbi:trp operon repressor [Chlamydia caviae]|uniref:Trp operon repressor homolog n=1 Tax=Chlamydia caviae (strain ATCC VR-813 / DSM 19441 / 03DC25 / GPIC) TaxID=227941 RepID=TRPR_CHLCV|nr:trp operon repressor [Chlamydia caviae]Q822W7.1 RecName: Full=Trp operon repressor homolog [Chlamydia caviae GPIC]AAP05304.1 trp operon repressor [Chlamydia caviae GPIC]
MAQESNENGWGDFLELCSKIKTPEAFHDFFALFLTFGERESMASRFLIVQALLAEQLTQREIAQKYGVSIAQITRGSNALKAIDPKFKEFLKNLNRKYGNQ